MRNHPTVPNGSSSTLTSTIPRTWAPTHFSRSFPTPSPSPSPTPLRSTYCAGSMAGPPASLSSRLSTPSPDPSFGHKNRPMHSDAATLLTTSARRIHRHEKEPIMALKPILLAFVLSPIALAQAPKPAGPPPTLKSILLAELRSTHNKAEWFVPINTAIAGMTPEQARWVPKSEGPNNPAPEEHSVSMIAYNLLYWNTQALHQLKGEKVPPPTSDNNETFNKF